MARGAGIHRRGNPPFFRSHPYRIPARNYYNKEAGTYRYTRAGQVMRKRPWLFGMTCVLASSWLAGCAGVLLAGGAAAGVGTFAYINGELQSSEKATMDQLWAATLQAAQGMQLRIVREEKDALNARLHAKGVENKDIFIKLKSVAMNETEIRIRINVFGDEAMSRRILAEIRKRLY